MLHLCGTWVSLQTEEKGKWIRPPAHTHILYSMTSMGPECFNNWNYYMTIGSWDHLNRESTNQITWLPIWYFPSIRPEIGLFKVADVEEIKAWKHSPWAILFQVMKAPILGLFWIFETIWKDQMKLLNMTRWRQHERQLGVSRLSEEHKSDNMLRKAISHMKTLKCFCTTIN